jgi:hypothetical protein
MGHAVSQSVVPTKSRRGPVPYQPFKNTLLKRHTLGSFFRFALDSKQRQLMANEGLQRHGAKVLLKPAEKEKGRFENRPSPGWMI